MSVLSETSGTRWDNEKLNTDYTDATDFKEHTVRDGLGDLDFSVMDLLLEMCGYQAHGLFDDVFVAAAAFEPVHVRFAAEPGELAFGVVAMALLGLGYGLFAGEFVLQDGGWLRRSRER